MGPTEAIAVTLDVDWAPDFAIDAAADALIRAGVPATWFVTHESPAVERLRSRSDIFELGIHPNFLPGSSHGASVAAIIEHLLEIVPDATSMRTHNLFQSSPLFDQIAAICDIVVDVSLFLPSASNLAPVRYRTRHAELVRLPYFWEDDVAMYQQEACWSPGPLLARPPSLKIFDFHPIHIALNSADMEPYERLKQESPDIAAADRDVVASHAHEGAGTATFFAELLERVAGHPHVGCVSDIAARATDS